MNIKVSGIHLALLTCSLCGPFLPLDAQTVAKPPVKTPASGGNSFTGPDTIRYVSGKDVQEGRIDLFMGDWHHSIPRSEHGSLVLRDILRRGSNLAPQQQAAILEGINFVAYGRLQPNDLTTSSKLQGQQEIYYIDGGARRDHRGWQDRRAS